MKTIILSTIVILVTGFIFRNDIGALVAGKPKSENLQKQKKQQQNIGSDVTIKQKWELPAILIEVSGIAYIDGQRFACVQDEAGTIFIYNTATATIEKEIVFTGPGDFEGIALNGNTAYIVRSDGVIFEVDMLTKKTTQHATFLTADNNVETLFYDAANKRLLMAGKEPDAIPSFKNIYAFNTVSKTLAKEPVVKIDLAHKALATPGNSKKKKKNFMPSAIAVHPQSNDIYILDGPKSRLLVTGTDGAVKNVYELGNEFYKPEGISFSPAGDLYISNEGKKIPGNILEVNIR